MTPTSRSPLVAVALGALLLVGAAACGSDDKGSAAAQPSDPAAVHVEDATIDWPANPETAAVRMVVVNDTRTDDVLVSVSSPAAERTTVHRTETDDQGRSTMTEQDDLPIPADSEVTFAPGGLHVMLDGITEDLEVGDEVDLTLTFEHAGSVSATAQVVEPGSVVDDTEGSHDH
ncbi:MAG TPA: copper chaperone PCu(A)C [Acidimicrobiales bacterium]|jgi:copper(I)-binding protein|nr:copper chaperone PCu(A)C [Acidimicrobiales bacterium]